MLKNKGFDPRQHRLGASNVKEVGKYSELAQRLRPKLFYFGLASVSCSGGLQREGARLHTPPQMPTWQSRVETNAVQIQTRTYDSTEEGDV